MFGNKAKYLKEVEAHLKTKEACNKLDVQNTELRGIINDMESKFALYQQRYEELYESTKDDIKDPVVKVNLEPKNVEIDALASKYVDVESAIPEVVALNETTPTAVVYGAGIKESLDARKQNDGTVTANIMVVVDVCNEVYAYYDGVDDLTHGYDHITNDMDAELINEIYMLNLELPKYSTHKVKI